MKTNILNKLQHWQVGLIIAVIGFGTYFSGLVNPFQGDDNGQIVNNLPVHSITNIKQFFEGGTFYYGPNYHLSGDYYRPLMTTTFSLLYSIFGPKTWPFHLTQLALYIGSAYLLYLIFCFPFKKSMAFFLSLLFLVHPINSQNVFAIPSMQDTLYICFGLLSVYLLLRLKTRKALYLSALCVMLSLFSKETAILFVGMSFVYLYWYDRQRLMPYASILVLPLAVYLFIRAHAIGWLNNPAYSPIAQLPLNERLLAGPEMILFYISKFLFPWKLSSSYFWVQTSFSYTHVLFPLLIDLVLILGIRWYGRRLYRQKNMSLYYAYTFFVIWFMAGIFMLLQIVPLDMTVSETWFIFPFIGLLGMIGVCLSRQMFLYKIPKPALLTLCVCLLGVLSLRTNLRGYDWQNTTKLTNANLRSSSLNWSALNVKAADVYSLGQVQQAKNDAQLSVDLFSNDINNYTLGYIEEMQGKLAQAEQSFKNGLRYQYDPPLDEDMYIREAILMNWFGDNSQNIQFVLNGLHKYPDSANLWLGLALLYYRSHQGGNATYAIIRADNLAQTSEINSVYKVIMSEGNLTIAKPK